MANKTTRGAIDLLKAMDDPDFGDDMSDDPEERAKYHESMAKYTLETIQEIIDSKPLTKEALRQYILLEGANAIRAVADRAKGRVKNAMDMSDVTSQNMLFNAVVPILQQAGDLKKIEANSVKEVLKLVGKGEISIQDARELVDMIKDRPIITIT